MRYACIVKYDGTEYAGFQIQKNAKTIQEEIEKALFEVTKSNLKINYSGRTDAGVHALSQIIDFETDIQRDKKNWLNGINSNLPLSIAVKDIFEVPQDFNSRFSAIERSYAYVIYNSKDKPLFFNSFSYWISNNIDLDKMTQQMKMLEGKHDFTSFRSVNCNAKNPIKKISNLKIQKINKFIILSFTANAFLQNMVRIMAGTLIDISVKNVDLSVNDIIKKRDRTFAGKTAPAKGLFFLGPRYKYDFNSKTFESDLLNIFGA